MHVRLCVCRYCQLMTVAFDGNGHKSIQSIQSACAFALILNSVLRMHDNAVQCGWRFQKGV